MKPLHIPATRDNPFIDFNPDGNLLIRGSSIPIDGCRFYEELIRWIEELCQDPPDEIVLSMEISYHNDSASKYLMQILRILNTGQRKLKINWIHESWDDEIIFLGQMMSELLDVEFSFIEK